MKFDYDLVFKYTLQNFKQIFLVNKKIKEKNTNILINTGNLYYVTLHLKLSSFFFSNQLLDIFSYENTLTKNKEKTFFFKNNNNTVVYNFNVLKNNTKIALFVLNQNKLFLSKNKKNRTTLLSITELFLNANWLEREAGELSGIFFYGKKDVRNLMLQYGDTSTPFKKSYPSFGLREISYDANSDLLIQNQTSIQF